MLSPLQQWYQRQEEPARSCFQFLRAHILSLDPRITESWKYGMPFFCYNGKMCLYFWIHKQRLLPYIGIVEGNQLNHPELVQEKRARMKILFIDPSRDLPMKKINSILLEALALYQHGKK